MSKRGRDTQLLLEVDAGKSRGLVFAVDVIAKGWHAIP